jgi:two-component sensor histidine kinase
MTEVSQSEPPSFAEDLLLREMTHRINNELASTIGFVSISASRSNNCEVKVALAGVMEHLHNHARVYRALQMPPADQWIDAAKYLSDLCQSISHSKLQYRGIELVFVERPLQLRGAQCWRLAMIVSELITNALRHAFGESGGIIRVDLLKRGSSVECSVTDNGSGSENAQLGQGLRIVRSLAQSLQGSIDQRFGTGGTIAILSFPIIEAEPGEAESHYHNFTHRSTKRHQTPEPVRQ